MKRSIISFLIILCASVNFAQTLHVGEGGVNYLFPASQTGEMTFSDGTTLTIMGRAFTLSDVATMFVDDEEVTDNLVSVVYNGTSATVSVSGNVAQYVTVSVSGAHVSIVQSTDVSDETCGEITYNLSGTSTDGEFYLEGSYKASIALAGLTLTNPSGTAINVQNGKRIDISVKKDTENTLTDGASGSQKGCLVVKGHAEFKGKGVLNVSGNAAHGIKVGEYMTVKNCTINVLSAAKDGIHCAEYYLQESGEVSVNVAGDDGLQVEIDGEASTGETTDHEDEDSGSFYFLGGALTATTSATAAKAIKAAGNITVSGGTISATTTGNGTWDSDDKETKACAAMSADGNLTITDGTVTLTSLGSGGKGAKAGGVMNIAGGSVTATTSGGLFYSNGTTTDTNYTSDTQNVNKSYLSSPKGLKATGNVNITGGSISVSTEGNNGEGIESKAVMTIEDGTITVNSKDDGLNSTSTMYLKGGTITVVATGNDGIDSNGHMYVSGGTIVACGAGGAECGIDANEEDGYSVHFTGGTLLAIGANNSTPSESSSTQAYVSGSLSVSGGSTVTLASGSTTLCSFTVPSNYSGSQSGGFRLPAREPGHGGGGWGGNGQDGGVLVTCPGLTSGNSYTLTCGSSSASVTAATTGGSSTGPGGGGGGMWW